MVDDGDVGVDPDGEEFDDRFCGAGRSGNWNWARSGSSSLLLVPKTVFSLWLSS